MCTAEGGQEKNFYAAPYEKTLLRNLRKSLAI
jgi:hypothetical protein